MYLFPTSQETQNRYLLSRHCEIEERNKNAFLLRNQKMLIRKLSSLKLRHNIIWENAINQAKF